MSKSSGERPVAKPKRDVLLTRITLLETLRENRRRPVDAEVRANLQRWLVELPVGDIAIRAEFLRRTLPLTPDEYDEEKLVDRPKPVLPRQPPLAALAPITKGVGLRVALTVPLLVQGRRRTALGRDARLLIPIEADEPGGMGLVDLVAVAARHRPRPGSTYASSVLENRKRQVRDGLLQLGKFGLAELPDGGRQGEPRFDKVHLNEEGGGTAAGTKRYTPPRDLGLGRVVRVPTAFYVNGWIHALSKSEIAMWLMLRDLHERSGTGADAALPLTPDRLHISGRDRLLEYDLSRAVWDTHSSLEQFGLIVVRKDPNRRSNGTTLDGEFALPHYFELTDDGLKQDGLSTVIDCLSKIHARKRRDHR